jgi:hypothetical protein
MNRAALGKRCVLICSLLVLFGQGVLGGSDPPVSPDEFLRVLVPDDRLEKWHECRGQLEQDLGIFIVLDVVPTTRLDVLPRPSPTAVIREVLNGMIDEGSLPDAAMIPRELARELSDRCYTFSLDAYEDRIPRPFRHDSSIEGVCLPWALDLVVVFFEPGKKVDAGLAVVNHPCLTSVSIERR